MITMSDAEFHVIDQQDVRGLMHDRYQWTGTVDDLLQYLERHCRNKRQATIDLQLLAPQMQAEGIRIQRLNNHGKGKWQITAARRTAADWMAEGACQAYPDWTDDGEEDIKTGICQELCPVLGQCRQWASGHKWSEVVIGGWAAPSLKNYVGAGTPPWVRNPHHWHVEQGVR